MPEIGHTNLDRHLFSDKVGLIPRKSVTIYPTKYVINSDR